MMIFFLVSGVGIFYFLCDCGFAGFVFCLDGVFCVFFWVCCCCVFFFFVFGCGCVLGLLVVYFGVFVLVMGYGGG